MMNSTINVAIYSGMEKDLNDDAAWKKIQQNTFTRWVNERLKCANLRVENIEKDFSDGLMLIALVEVLSQKRIHRYNKKPTLRTHQLENVSLALKFLEDVEKVHLVNIDSSDIVDQRLKLILGLIWTLILKYSISMPIMAAEDQKDVMQKETPKQRLLSYIQAKIPSGGVTNFTSDWKDGRALGALVDSCAPGLCPDWNGWHQNYALQNTTEAMSLADDWLGVPKLIEPQEFINPNVDEMSMMTYLSQYSNAKLKEGAPIRPETNYSKIRVFGAGIDAVYVPMCATADFMVEVPDAVPNSGRLEVVIQHYTGLVEPVYVSYHEETHTYVVSYVPTAQGVYSVYISYNGKDLSSSPYKIQVEPAREEKTIEKREVDFVDQSPEKVDASKIVVDQIKKVHENALSLMSKKFESIPSKFIATVDIEDSWNSLDSTFRNISSGSIFSRYSKEDDLSSLPSRSGFSSVGKNANQIQVFGSGLYRATVGQKASFVLQASEMYNNSKDKQLEVVIEGPQPATIWWSNIGKGLCSVTYVPRAPGFYVVAVLSNGMHAADSPYFVHVEEKRKGPVVVDSVLCSSSRTLVFDHALRTKVFVNAENNFRIDCRLLPKHGLSHLTCFMIEPSGQRTQLKIEDNEDGTYKVDFAPREEG
uniref:Calponin-homology (CH) domain-containing protein n=1 Tax=Romanomermis culicivorax TaxID=13658 RepID=A0A915KP50_ROMCU